jgi:5-methylcytosine-specific restriction protein A
VSLIFCPPLGVSSLTWAAAPGRSFRRRPPFYVGYERDRGSARSRGYSTRWDKAAATFKLRNPLCLGCRAAFDRAVPAEVVDHVEPHKGDQAKFWNTKLWQPACRWHHDAIKPRLERMFESREIKVADLWLNSDVAIALTKRTPQRQAIGLDGWPG